MFPLWKLKAENRGCYASFSAGYLKHSLIENVDLAQCFSVNAACMQGVLVPWVRSQPIFQTKYLLFSFFLYTYICLHIHSCLSFYTYINIYAYACYYKVSLYTMHKVALSAKLSGNSATAKVRMVKVITEFVQKICLPLYVFVNYWTKLVHIVHTLYIVPSIILKETDPDPTKILIRILNFV